MQTRSQEFDAGGHSRLDVNRLDVVPALFEEGSEEIEGHHDVGLELFISHIDVTDGGGHAGDLLKLELNGGTGVHDLHVEGLVVGDNGGESLDSGEDGSDDDGHLLQDGVGSEEESVLLGPLLDSLLVLVELLKLIEGSDIDVESELLGLGLVLGVSDKADLEGGAGDVGESHGSDESLILLGIVILKGNLKLNSFSELAGLDQSAEALDTDEDVGVCNLGGRHLLVFLFINDYHLHQAP